MKTGKPAAGSEHWQTFRPIPILTMKRITSSIDEPPRKRPVLAAQPKNQPPSARLRYNATATHLAPLIAVIPLARPPAK
jgi:hypothetical protein